MRVLLGLNFDMHHSRYVGSGGRPELGHHLAAIWLHYRVCCMLELVHEKASAEESCVQADGGYERRFNQFVAHHSVGVVKLDLSVGASKIGLSWSLIWLVRSGLTSRLVLQGLTLHGCSFGWYVQDCPLG